MSGPGLAALPEGGRIDFAALRRDRTDRLFDAMAAADLDALVVGRPADVAFASGARQLWTAGSRPFSATCVLVGADRRVHVLSTWDEGVPPEIPREHLFGLSWNPAVAAGHVQAIPGLATARRVGTGGTSAGLQRLLSSTAPDADLVDARELLRSVRQVKSPAEVSAIETSCALAEAGLEAMHGALRPGVTSRQLMAVLAERLGSLGAQVLPDGSVAHDTTDGFRTVVDDRPITDGALVVLSPSASYWGYEGTTGRTVAVGETLSAAQTALGARCRAGLDAMISACVPGATGRAVREAWGAAGGRSFPAPLAHGVGLGTEPPVIGLGIGGDAQLRSGVVLAVQGWMYEPGVGGWLERDVVELTADGPRILTRWGPRRPTGTAHQ